jgi:hypothetical protein
MPLFGRKKEEPKSVSQIKPVEQPLLPEEKPSQAVELLRMNLQKLPAPSKQQMQQKPQMILPPMSVKIPEPAPVEEIEEPVEMKKEIPQFAPLFIKLDKYKNILHEMAELKMTMLTIKNTLAVVNEMDKLKTDSMKMIQDAITRVDKKLATLDTEFLKPTGYHDIMPQQMATQDMQSELDALRGQIEALRYEMEETA